MTLGPPPSAAGPSNNSTSYAREDASSSQATPPQPGATSAHLSAPTPGPSVSTGPYTSQFAVQPQPTTHSYYGGSHAPAFSAAQSYPAQTGYYAQPRTSQPTGNYSYYGYPPNAWANAWNTSTYQYPSGGPYTYAAPQQSNVPPQPPAQTPSTPQQQKEKTPSPSPSPTPPPEYHKEWDAIIKAFLSSLGFTQALRGFEADMIVLNAEWERKKVPTALAELMKDLLRLGQVRPEGDESAPKERPLEERKLDCVHLSDGATPRSQTSITKDISRFLAQNRARNDASNRNEFLLSLAEKRRRLNENGDSTPSASIPSCARTDAKTQNRDLQMKYDIAKNEDGPLRRTMKTGQPDTVAAQAGNKSTVDASEESAQRYPGLDERLQNIEKHLAIRYVPSPPKSLLDRLKFLEDHIIHLEREYPPWAALHFNQPNRGWPPPPRATPIVVPSYLTSTAARQADDRPSTQSVGSTTDTSDGQKAKGKQARHTQSSLHRAVLEKLEVQKAMNDPH
ncbi:hypothetical protein L226DRAFT_598555 [Lentinus tigrinus ALCF2SS1-7]|uniref:uncharacterized protein n=1 Tax=Lentinus tigrinus ALCF2SS1-7 TaxID=1328758 RepID=UPI001165F51F|nr:hypothetical protein L226DRAFT_598555 [Lentinus tigrinus ALCF2SS1-7]